MKRLTVTAIVDASHSPANRFRFKQLAPWLVKEGIDLRAHETPKLDWHDPKWRPLQLGSIIARFGAVAAFKLPGLVASRVTDATIVSRQYVQGLPFFEAGLGKPWVLDVDDALWEARPYGELAAREAAKRASAVVAASPVIAEWYGRYNSRVELIPTSVETSRYTPATRAPERFTLGWIGSRSNLPFLERLSGVFAAFLSKHRDARMLVMSDGRPDFPGVPAEQLECVPWSADTEIEAIQRMSVGLMPLDDTPVARGKAAAKMLTYASCGVPTIASPVGVNADILKTAHLGWAASTSDEWSAALDACLSNPNDAAARGRAGREHIEANYSARLAAEKWARLLRELTSK
jgi:glycosyltransferase involved in cell wall biosynthesis